VVAWSALDALFGLQGQARVLWSRAGALLVLVTQ
jgi:hypothetical protein